MTTDAGTRFTRRDWWMTMAVAAIALFVYLPALTTWFVSDDAYVLTIVRRLDGLHHPLGYFELGFFEKYYRPLAFLSQAIDWSIWGVDATGFHLTNICLHAANAVLVYVIGRQLTDSAGATVAALLFALHPASHEPVYWIAGRFDLLATFFVLLSALLLSKDGSTRYVIGLGAFALALLSKESAAALPIIATAFDVMVRRRSWQSTVARLIPLLGVLAGYALLRGAMANLSLAGGGNRIPKLAMMIAALAALVWLASTNRPRRSTSGVDLRGRPPGSVVRPRAWQAIAAALGVAAVLAICLSWPATRDEVILKMRFVTFAAFNTMSPIVFPALPAFWLDYSAAAWIAGAAVTVVAAAGVVLTWRWFAARPVALFSAAFVIAALIPVSSLTEGPRYLYLASAGSALFVAYAWRALPAQWIRPAGFTLALVLAISTMQLTTAAREWRRASTISRDALTLISGDMAPCGTKSVTLLTTPVNIGGARINFLYNAPDAFGLCPWASLTTVLRVWTEDIHVDPTLEPSGALTLRVPNYAGNIEASKDLHNFGLRLTSDRTAHIETPIGVVDASPDGDAEVFHLQLTPDAARAALYYYSDGAIRPLRPGG